MTVYALSLEYGQTAADLYRRIVELEKASKEAQDETVKHQMEGRIRSLRSMYNDTRRVARQLEHYYDRQPPKKASERRTAKRRV